MEYKVIPISQLEQASWDQIKDGEYIVPIGFSNQPNKESKYIDIWQLQDTINISDIIEQATEIQAGLMSAEDKIKLNALDPSISMNDNLINGSAEGSLRTIGSFEEEGDYSLGQHAFTEGNTTQASGYASHAEGFGAIASGNVSHAEGYFTQVTSDWSHVEGFETLVSGNYAHAEGSNTIASDAGSHAEGTGTRASAEASHAEGSDTIASGVASHAQGLNTIASGDNSHTEGTNVTASGNNSHAQNYSTIAASENQTAIGKYNIEDSENQYSLIVGNGLSNNSRSNAVTIDWEGNVTLQGDVYTNNSVFESDKLITQTELNSAINNSTTSIIDKVDKSSIGYTINGQPRNISTQQSFLDLIYPIGSVYISVNNTNPSTWFGGIWQPLAPGRMLLGADESNYVSGDNIKGQGGNKNAIIPTHTHTIPAKTGAGTAVNNGSHYHGAGDIADKSNHTYASSFIKYNYGKVKKGLGELKVAANSSSSHVVPYMNDSNVDYFGATTTTAPAGIHNHSVNLSQLNVPTPSGSQTIENANMPPYLVVNMWKRIS